MATDTRTDGSPPPPDVSEVRSSLTEAFAQADDVAGKRVQQLQLLYQARASQFGRIAADVKAKPGANEADIQRAEAALASTRAASSQVAMLHRRITTPEPSVTPDGWALHGRVVSETREPIAGFTVFFVDTAKAYQQAYGFTSTDETGYFLLRYEGASATSPAKVTTAKEASAAELFVEVTGLKGRLAYLSDTAFRPIIGAAIYQDIVLADGASTKGEPPAQVRKVSMPKREPKR